MKTKFKILPLLFIIHCSLFILESKAQRPNYSEDVATIIYNNCTSCHRAGEIGPMPFTNYTQVSAYGNMIEQVTSIRYMPPWMPDKNYSHFLDERGLTNQEIQTIKDWVTNGMPQGNPALEPPLPNFPVGSQLGTPDLVLAMDSSFTHKGTNEDDYRIFVLPSTVTQDKDIAAIEFRPGNPDIVHHGNFAIDTQRRGRALDSLDGKYGYGSYGGFGGFTPDGAIGGWTPGQTPRFAPSGFGTRLFANSDVLMQIHYGPSSILAKDSSVLNIFYSDVPVTRPVLAFNIRASHSGEPFIIPADSVKSFHATFTLDTSVVPIPIDLSLMFVYPHSHLLCKSWEVYGIKPNGDTLKIIKINNWDFNWQAYYSFEKLTKVPFGSTLHAHVTYDNTSNNPLNPNNPPQQIGWGERTIDEMLLLVFGFVIYQPGDENISLATGMEDDKRFKFPENKLYPAYPNPTNGEVSIGFKLAKSEKISLSLYDLKGKLIQEIKQNQFYTFGNHQINVDINHLNEGIYIYKLKTPTFSASERFILIR